MLADGTDLYQNPALYELEHGSYRGDLPFYRMVAGQAQPPVILELGCGLGRVTFELAAAGYAVTGVDAVPAMLVEIERRLTELPPAVRQRVRVQNGDARNYRHPSTHHGAVLAPFNLLQHQDATGLTAVLQTAHANLVEGGLFACDLFAPLPTDAVLEDVDFTGADRHPLPQDGGTLLVDRREHYDREKALLTTTIRCRMLRPDDSLAGTEQRTLCRRQWTRDQLLQALAAARFDVVSCYGDIDFTPCHSLAPRIMLIAKKKG
jgi:SAM-dependent methyltransferase